MIFTTYQHYPLALIAFVSCLGYGYVESVCFFGVFSEQLSAKLASIRETKTKLNGTMSQISNAMDTANSTGTMPQIEEFGSFSDSKFGMSHDDIFSSRATVSDDEDHNDDGCDKYDDGDVNGGEVMMVVNWLWWWWLQW